MTKAEGPGVASQDPGGFEKLISDISARLIASPPDQVDLEIVRSMGLVRTHFNSHRCGLLRIQQDRKNAFVSHADYAEGYEPVAREINLITIFPETYASLLRGEVCPVRSVADMPPSLDRESFLKMGVRSCLHVPLWIEGGLRYIFALNCMTGEYDWPREYIPRLRLLGEMFVNALERRRWEMLLRESEERTRLAAESAGAGLWSLDSMSGCFWLADATRALFGLPPDASLTLGDFLGLVHPEDLERVRAALDRGLREGGRNGVEYRVVLPGVGTRWIDSRGCLVSTISGDRLMGLSIDITGRKQTEIGLRDDLERMAAAADVARLGFYEVFWDEQRVAIDDVLRNLLGIGPQEEPRALEFWLERIHPEDRGKVQESRRGLLENDMHAVNVEYRFLHPRDGQLWLRHSARSVEREPGGKILRGIGVICDVTGQKRVEEELRRTLEEVRRLRDEYQQQNTLLREQISHEVGQGAIVGESEPALRALQAARRVAPTDSHVLITGETGTGKELLAEAIHGMSRRGERLMVRVNCAALPATLIESELFGREKGAYTGAMTRQIGRFEQANGSTIFLDEIAELPLEMQPKLLRVLQDGQFERLGSPLSQKVDVRVIAATNRDLPSLVKEGRFRQDLFYRLNVFPIEAPPLRERREDIPLLVWSFVRHFSQKMGKSIDTIPRQTMERLQRHSWPGNVRELRNMIERSVILSDTRVLAFDFPGLAASDAGTFATLEEAERRHILLALERSGWHIRRPRGAAEQLGMNPTTLHSKLKKLGISRPKP